MSRVRFVVAVAAVASFTAASDVAQHQGHGAPAAAPYEGQQSREIKALSEEEVRGYLAGAGMGLAKTAELNRYPGPMHTLENAEALGLDAQQRPALEALMRVHMAEARELGAEVVRLERELDRLFAERSATEARVDATLAKIALAQAKLRGSHLKAHLAATRLLTAAQVERYTALRGYGGAAASRDGHRGH